MILHLYLIKIWRGQIISTTRWHWGFMHISGPHILECPVQNSQATCEINLCPLPCFTHDSRWPRSLYQNVLCKMDWFQWCHSKRFMYIQQCTSGAKIVYILIWTSDYSFWCILYLHVDILTQQERKDTVIAQLSHILC